MLLHACSTCASSDILYRRTHIHTGCTYKKSQHRQNKADRMLAIHIFGYTLSEDSDRVKTKKSNPINNDFFNMLNTKCIEMENGNFSMQQIKCQIQRSKWSEEAYDNTQWRELTAERILGGTRANRLKDPGEPINWWHIVTCSPIHYSLFIVAMWQHSP